MTNYEAIMKMSKQQLAMLLSDVHCTGLNDGIHLSKKNIKNEDTDCGANPFDEAWLSEEAEPAILQEIPDDPDERYLLNAMTASILRNAGIDPSEIENDGEDIVIV